MWEKAQVFNCPPSASQIVGGNYASNCIQTMTFGVKRIVIRDEKILVSKKKDGLFLHNKNGQLENKLGHEDYQLLDFTRNSRVAVLNGKEWLIKGNANRTSLKFLDTSTNTQIFETTKYLAFRDSRTYHQRDYF
jgi:hypothetical protein